VRAQGVREGLWHAVLRFVVIVGILEIDPIVEQRLSKTAVEIGRGQ
jgi:hypothetical protein